MDIENEPKNYFIYKYTFPDGKVYIGQTQLSGHRFGNKTAYRGQPVYEAMNKYPNYKKEGLELVSKKFVNNREEYWILYYDSTNPEKGYNIKNVSKNVNGARNKTANRFNFLKSKPVLQYDIDGNFIAEYPSIRNAALSLGKIGNCGSDISEYLNYNKYNKKHVYEFVWKYKNESDKIINNTEPDKESE